MEKRVKRRGKLFVFIYPRVRPGGKGFVSRFLCPRNFAALARGRRYYLRDKRGRFGGGREGCSYRFMAFP